MNKGSSPFYADRGFVGGQGSVTPEGRRSPVPNLKRITRKRRVLQRMQQTGYGTEMTVVGEGRGLN